MNQLTKQQILERFAGQNEVRVKTRLGFFHRPKSPKFIRFEEMDLALEWTKDNHLRFITPMDIRWAEAEEANITEQGDIIVDKQLMQLFAIDGAGQPQGTQEQVGRFYVYREGELYSQNRTVWPEAGEYNFHQNTHELRIFGSQLKKKDKEDIQRGPAQFGLLVEGDIIFLLYQFGTSWPLSDAPYTIHMVKNDMRTMPPDPSSLTDNQGIGLNILLVNAQTGIIEAIRFIGMDHDFSVALLKAIHLQAERPFSQRDFDRQLMEAYKKYPTTVAMWSSAIKCEIPAR
jgi:hypothetical protein